MQDDTHQSIRSMTPPDAAGWGADLETETHFLKLRPLHVAISSQNSQCVSLLLKAGADFEVCLIRRFVSGVSTSDFGGAFLWGAGAEWCWRAADQRRNAQRQLRNLPGWCVCVLLQALWTLVLHLHTFAHAN